MIKYKCLSCNKDYSYKLDEKFEKRFENIFKFSNNYINKSIFLLREGVYHDESMDDWGKFNKTSLPEKKELCSNLNMKDTADADYMHAKKVYKDFEIKILCEYHDCILNATLLLAKVFKNFRKMCLKMYHLDPVKISSSSWISMTSSFKKD